MSDRRKSYEMRKVPTCLLIFAALLAWPAEPSCQQTSPERRRVVSAKQFLEEIKRCEKTGQERRIEQLEVRGEIWLGPDVIKGILCPLWITNTVFNDNFMMFGSTDPKMTIFRPDVHFSGCIFKGSVLISSVKFSSESSRVQQIVFEACNFERSFHVNDVDASQRFASFSGCNFFDRFRMVKSSFCGAEFLLCRFLDDASFGTFWDDEYNDFLTGTQENDRDKVTFGAPVNFTGGLFKRRALFPYAEFAGALFKEVVFEGPVRFSKAKFKGETDFSRAVFEASADFERAIFYPNSLDGNQSDIAHLNAANAANFYKASFRDDVSFSKAVFLVDVDFKRASFGQRALFTNAVFAKRANFEMCVFEKELLGSMLNNPIPFLSELLFYQLSGLFDKETDPNTPWKDRKERRESVGNNDEVNKKAEALVSSYKAGRKELLSESARLSAQGLDFWPKDDDLKKDLAGMVESGRGKVAYITKTAFEILTATSLSATHSEFTVPGAHFAGEVDLRDAWFGVADFSSGDALTVFSGPVDLSNVSFMKKVHVDGTVFLGKVNLPLKNLFSKSGMISRSLTILPRIIPEEADCLQAKNKNTETLKRVYEGLEPVFRQYAQVAEANEMAVRAARERLKRGEDVPASLLDFFAIPIGNLLLIILCLIVGFYLYLVFKKPIYGRVKQRTFEQPRMPVVYIPDENTQSAPGGRTPDVIDKIERWQQYVWPLYVCLGTFFALFSLGSKYATKDPKCLRNMKILRFCGFLLIPLLIYSLAKKSEGLHRIFTLM